MQANIAEYIVKHQEVKVLHTRKIPYRIKKSKHNIHLQEEGTRNIGWPKTQGQGSF